MAKRGYTRDTIRGGASEWDVSRPLSSALRLLATLVVHPVRFFDVLPRVPDPRAPALFIAFAGAVSALLWLLIEGPLSAVAVFVLALPASLVLALPYHLASWGGRYGFLVTWRTLAYPFGFCLPLTAVPGLRWAATAYAGFVLLSVGLHRVRELPAWRAALVATVVTAAVLVPVFLLTR
jgi:hypothetical protein